MRVEYTMDDTNTLFKKLIQAIRACDENTVATLIEHGVDVEQDGNKALILACQLGYTSIVKCLIEADANIHQNNNEALWLAVTHRHAAVTVVLMAQGADHMDREGAIWEEATKSFTSEDEFTALIDLGAEALSDMDWELQLDLALHGNNQVLADVLVEALPNEPGTYPVLIALDHGKLTLAKQFLDNGVDFQQDNERSAIAYYYAWINGCKSLLPQLFACGATTSGALYEYIYGSHLSISELDAEFLAEMLKISKFEKTTCEHAVEIAISNNFLDIAVDAICHLADFPASLESIFYSAFLHNAKELYPLLMSLKAVIRFSDDDISWLDDFIINCTDRTLISYLLAQVGPSSLLKVEKLLDKAIEEKDWEWVKYLVCLGVRPSLIYGFDMAVVALIDNIEHDRPYQFTTYLQVAEKGGGWAAKNVADRYLEGDGIEKNKQQAAYWYTKAAEYGYISLNLMTMLALGDGIEQDKPSAIHLYRLFSNDANCIRSAEMQAMYDQDALERILGNASVS